MYYYIFDIKKCKKRSQVEDIKNHLGRLGISGEFTFPTAAQSAEELVDLGLSKKYNTIVAIGGEEIANAVAARLLGRKEAFGIIPLEAEPELSSLVGAETWQEACEALRYRRVTEINLGQTASGHYFLTSVYLDLFSPLEITLEFKDYLVQVLAQELRVANYYPGVTKKATDYLDILITSFDPKASQFVHKLTSLFGTKHESREVMKSLFRARSLRLFAKTPVPVMSHEQIIAKTPQLIESTDETVRLIVSKKSAHS